MDLAKYIVKARPGVLGGKHEEKRPLRQLSALPVKRYISSIAIRIPMPIFTSRFTKLKICLRRSPIIRCRTAIIPTSSIILSAITRI